jgi:hypothetical protein
MTGEWKNPLDNSRLRQTADTHCTPGLSAFIDALARSPPRERPQYAPAPMPPPSDETLRQGILALKPVVLDYQRPPAPVYTDAALAQVLQRGFSAQQYVANVNVKLHVIDDRIGAERDAVKKLATIREARNVLWQERCLCHGLERVIEKHKPIYDGSLPEVRRAMSLIDAAAPAYAAADDACVKGIRAGKLK